MEIWKDLKDYEDHYQISSLGRIKSLARKHKFGTLEEKIMKPSKNVNGYYQVNLWKNGKVKLRRVHRLVAETFISNPENLPHVNHKNEIKSDNRVENLEWCDIKYNNEYGSHKFVIEKMAKLKRKKVIQYDKQLNVIKVWDSLSSITKELGYNKAFISKCCLGSVKQCYGYIWKYKDD